MTGHIVVVVTESVKAQAPGFAEVTEAATVNSIRRVELTIP